MPLEIKLNLELCLCKLNLEFYPSCHAKKKKNYPAFKEKIPKEKGRRPEAVRSHLGAASEAHSLAVEGHLRVGDPLRNRHLVPPSLPGDDEKG